MTQEKSFNFDSKYISLKKGKFGYIKLKRILKGKTPPWVNQNMYD